MASKFAQFLSDNKIDPRRVVAASRQLERLRPEDRQNRLARRRAKKSEKPAAAGAAAPVKPRSGRAASLTLISAASGDRSVSGPAKTRLLRAVNRILEQKKQPAVELKSLF